MNIGRRTIVMGGAAMLLAPNDARAAAESLAAAISADGGSIRVVRMAVENGNTAIADVVLPADPSPYPLFRQFLTRKASRAAIYRAPANLVIAAKPVQAKDLIFIAEGDTTLKAGPRSRRCRAGSFILVEPGAAHDEQAGPDGYTAVKIRLVD